MALPKEPRQKMINIMYLVLTAILALNVSAEVIEAFRTVKTSLENSSSNIKASNDVLYKSLTDKLSKPESAKQAAIWQPLAEKAKQYSAELDAYIEGLKTEIKQGAGLRMVEKDGKQVEEFKLDDLQASTRIMEQGKKGDELKAKLDEYKQKMLNIDPQIKAAFASTFPVNTDPIHSQEGGTKEFTQGYFHMTPAIAALTMLSKFQNNIKNAENQVVTYCHNQIGAVEVHFDQAAVLVSQSSNYLMPNDKLTIKAGVGAYSSAANPTISINGSNVNVVSGVGQTDITASGAGTHSVVVRVQYLDEHKVMQTKEETIQYTVGTPGGSAVMLDKMNVFYIGVDNPVTIGSPTGWDKTSVSMTGGTITGSGSNRIVRVTTPGAAKIIVTADGKSTPFDLRVKRIPDPVIKVGPSGGGRMQALVFRSQQFVRADLEAFDFEAKYNVTGATVYFNNPGDRNVKSVTLTSGSLAPAKAFMDQLMPGSTVTFDNIRVVGPDGQTRTIQNPPGFSLF